MAEHTSKQFDLELEAVRTRVLQMGGLVEQQILSAIDALMAGDIDKLQQIVEQDVAVNEMEVAIDDDCTHIIARRQPAASDLRMLRPAVNRPRKSSGCRVNSEIKRNSP